MNVGNSKFKTASLLLIRPRLQVSKWLASHEQRHATSLLCGELCHWAAFNCRAKTDVCFSGIPMNSLCQSFRRLPLFFFFFYIFLSFSFHFPFIFLSLDSMSLRLVKTVVAAGLGSCLHNCRQGKHRKQMSKRQDTPGQTKNSSLPASRRADRAGIAPYCPQVTSFDPVATKPKGFPSQVSTDFFHLRAGISPRSLWTACSWPAGSRRSGTLNIERRNTKNSSRGCPRMSRMYRKKSDTLW